VGRSKRHGLPLLVAKPGDLGAGGADIDEGHQEADAVDGLALPDVVDLVLDRTFEAAEEEDHEPGHQQRGDGERDGRDHQRAEPLLLGQASATMLGVATGRGLAARTRASALATALM
jgi:hypothetical protein